MVQVKHLTAIIPWALLGTPAPPSSGNALLTFSSVANKPGLQNSMTSWTKASEFSCWSSGVGIISLTL